MADILNIMIFHEVNMMKKSYICMNIMNIMIEYHDVKYYDEELYLHMKEMHRGTDWLRDFHVKGPKTWPAPKRTLLKTTKKWQVCFQNRQEYITNIYHWLMDFHVKREKT